MAEVMGSIPIRGQFFLTIPIRKPIMPMLPFFVMVLTVTTLYCSFRDMTI